MTFRPVTEPDVPALVALWEACGLIRPWNPPDEDIAEFRAHPTAEVLAAFEDGRAIASVAVSYDGHRGWVYYLATEPARQGEGLARSAMAAAESWLRERGVRKLQLMVRSDNGPVLDFYRHLGFDEGHTTLMQKWLDPERDRLYREAGG